MKNKKTMKSDVVHTIILIIIDIIVFSLIWVIFNNTSLSSDNLVSEMTQKELFWFIILGSALGSRLNKII